MSAYLRSRHSRLGAACLLWANSGPQLRPFSVPSPPRNSWKAICTLSIEGFRVKARLACWVRLGDLDPANGSTDGREIALSIVRDLIRLYDQHLEHPGALTALVQEIEQEASKATP